MPGSPAVTASQSLHVEPIGNIPPAEAEARHYAELETVAMAAWDLNKPVIAGPAIGRRGTG